TSILWSFFIYVHSSSISRTSISLSDYIWLLWIPVSLSIALIPQSSRLGFRSIIHSVFLPLITFSVILFAILAPIILPLAGPYTTPFFTCSAVEPQYLHLIVISTPVLL
ncbi:MAG: hypothetical protein MRQ08_03420, partial [Candidatus Midichloria mitochondrii]|nr:hypothetical protein [Candidatus Midichloria mitochondrii]